MPENFSINLISLGIGLAIGLVTAIYFWFRANIRSRQLRKEIARQKQMLQDRLEVEMESAAAMRNKLKDLEELNSNLRQSIETLSHKATRQELQQLAIYQKAIDMLSSQSPGFGPAWQNVLQASREELAGYQSGVKPFIRNIVKGVMQEEIE
jgi:hypothetical protein